MDLVTAPPPELTVLPAARLPLQQLVTAGSLRMVMGFGESREYVDQVLALTRLPATPPWMLGVFGAEGEAVPLIDLAAWAQRRTPERWTIGGSSWTDERSTNRVISHATTVLRALRFGEGASAWAIRVSVAPSLLDLTLATARPVSNSLPLSVSSDAGQLMQHTSQVWSLPSDSVALQVRWPSVFEALLQELSGSSAV